MAFLASILANAQNVPLSVNYQSVVRSQSGTVLPNQQVSIRFSIIRDSILGNIMYQEQHTVVSNDFGLVNLKLGEGVPLLSQFRLIDWSLKSILVKIELSIGGSPFTTMGEEGFSSVPYSIYSNRSSYTDSLSRDAINTLPKLTLSGDTLYYGSNDTVPLQLSSYTLTEAEVDAYVSNNGYLTSEIDGSVTNEIQDLQLNNHSLTVTNNSTATTIDLTPYLDNTNLSESQVDAYVSNNGYLTTEIDGSVTNEIQDLQLNNHSLTVTNNTTATTIDLTPYLDNTNLSESQVDAYVSNNGYLTSEIDGSVTNEIQDLQLNNHSLTVTNNTTATTIDLTPYLDNTNLSESQVDAYVANNGYLTTEVDGSVTNEIQDLDQVLNEGNDASNQALLNVKRQSIGLATIDTSAALDISSTIQGFLPPRMTQIQRDAIFNPAAGLLVWCSDCGSKGLFSVFTGTSWSELQLTSPEGSIPTVSTFPITSYGFNSATVSGAVTYNGGKSVLAKGLCYSKTPNPNISDFVTATDTGNGSMSYILNNLDSNSKYFVRAYAQNQNGISYGVQQEFTTKRTIAIGDTFGGGIVGYILKAGDIGYIQGEQHGIIVSEIHSINQRVEYGTCGTGLNYPEYQPNIMVLDSTKTQRRLLSAIHNMNLINNTCNNVSSVSYFVKNWIYNGYSDWVIPSLDDLYAIKSNQIIINSSLGINHQLKTGGVQYWSSTTYGQFGVFQVSFGPNYFGDIFNSTASSAYFIPVRYF
jgi:nitrate reductase cytochrome c-type subunit